MRKKRRRKVGRKEGVETKTREIKTDEKRNA